MKQSQIVLLLVHAFYFVGLLALALLSGGEIRTLRQEAIDRGFAQYCPITGEWSWKDDCNG